MMAGRFYEDWTVGERIEHAIRRTVTETDNLLITTLTHNVQPLHLDAEAAAASEFGRILVNGVLIANLGYDQLLMPKPVFVGDTLRGDTTVAELRESRSRPQAGIVIFAHRMLNQRDEIVCTCLRTALIRKKPA
jgi:acyl dehydratase